LPRPPAGRHASSGVALGAALSSLRGGGCTGAGSGGGSAGGGVAGAACCSVQLAMTHFSARFGNSAVIDSFSLVIGLVSCFDSHLVMWKRS
jgi:hypothetical protein